jgi:hypothetical protein
LIARALVIAIASRLRHKIAFVDNHRIYLKGPTVKQHSTPVKLDIFMDQYFGRMTAPMPIVTAI